LTITRPWRANERNAESPSAPSDTLHRSRWHSGTDAVAAADRNSGLGTGPKEIGFAAAAYGVGVAASALVAAPQLGHWQKRQAIRSAFLLLTGALIVCGLAWSWHILAGGQLMAGLASGVIIPATYALTGDIAAPGSALRLPEKCFRLVGGHGRWRTPGGVALRICGLARHLFRVRGSPPSWSLVLPCCPPVAW
jgi:MFS family permease